MVHRSGSVNVLLYIGVMYSGMCVAVLYCIDGNAVWYCCTVVSWDYV